MDKFLARYTRLSPVIVHGGPLLLLAALLLGAVHLDRYATRLQMQVHQQEAGVLADQTARHLEGIFESRFLLVHHLTHEWERQIAGRRPTFTEEALHLHDMFPGFQAINWVDRDGTIRWVTPADKNPGLEGQSILNVESAVPIFEAVADTFVPHVTPPVPLLQGFVGIVGYFPVTKAETFDGVVTAVFNPAEIIQGALSPRLDDQYHLTVKGEGQTLFESAGDGTGAPFAVKRPVQVWDQLWTLTLTPTRAAARIEGLSDQVKTLIVMLSVLISGLVWMYLKRLRDLIRANNAKSEFLANMSHELRTPLNSVIGYGEMMQYEVLGPMPGPYKDYATLITSSGRLLLESISAILDIAKIEEGHFELQTAPTDMHALLTEVLTVLDIQAQQKGLPLHDETTDLPELVVDPVRVKQVLLNVIGNAIKFTDHGSVTVQNRDQGGEHVLQVIDTGIGMTADQIEVALLPFRQVHGTSQARRYQGTGLGLSLSRQVMAQHGGRLIIKSAPERGTTVELAFPFKNG